MRSVLAIVLLAACSQEPARLAAPPFDVGSSVARSYRPPWVQMVPCGKAWMPITHPAEWRTTFDSEFGLFQLTGQGWYDWASDKSKATIEIAPVYIDGNGDGAFQPTEVDSYIVVGVRDGQEVRKP